MTDDELKQLVASNARSIQALGDCIAELTNDVNTFVEENHRIQEQAANEREELRRATLGIANLLSKLDEERPTILRKLDTIENMVSRLLEQEENHQ